MSLAFSIAESLLHSDALTLFVTHYPLVTTLTNLYPNVKNFHLKTSFATVAGAAVHPQEAAGGMVYLHTVAAGTCDMKAGYGIMMAMQCGFPQDVIDDAQSIKNTVREVYPTLYEQDTSACESEDQCAIALHSLLQHLQLLKDSPLDDMDLRVYLSNLRSKVSDEAVEQMLLYLEGSAEGSSEDNVDATNVAVVD